MEHLDNEATALISKILTDDDRPEQEKLAVLGFLKSCLSPKPTVQQNVLYSISIQNLTDLFKYLRKQNVDFNVNSVESYGELLLDNLKAIRIIDEDFTIEFQWVLLSLLGQTAFLNKVWSVFVENQLPGFKIVLKHCDCFIEQIETLVSSWAESLIERNVGVSGLDIMYYIENAAICPIFFQILTSILNQYVINLNGNKKILFLVFYFIETVKLYCENVGNSLCKLYPREVYRLISLLSIPTVCFKPKEISKCNRGVFREDVLELIARLYNTNKELSVMILTHFPDWISYFVDFLEINCMEID